MPALLKSTSMPPKALRRLAVHALHVVWVGYVGVDVDAVYLGGRLLPRLVCEVRYADAGAFLGEASGRLAADAAGAAGYDGDLPSRRPGISVLLRGQVDVLYLGVVVEGVRAELASDAGLLEAAEGWRPVRRCWS